MMEKDTAFSEYAGARWQRLVRAGVLLGCDVPEAEDLAQQTLLRCYLKWRQVQRADDRDAYVARIQLNLLRQSRRRKWWGETAIEVPDPSVPDATDRIDDADALKRALGSLPEAQRQAIVLRYYLHLTEQQIAAVAGVAPGTVKSRISRAMTALAASPGLLALREGQP
jgi:RNA polymerase sigma-70 factor (sigma-E family)